MSLLYLAQVVALDFAVEHRQRTIRRAISMGSGSRELFTGKILAGMLTIVPFLLIVFVLGGVLLALPAARLLSGWALACAAAFGVLGAICLLALIPRNPNQANVVTNIVILPVSFLGGCYFPIEVLDEKLHAVASRLPMGWIVERIKDVVLGRALRAGAAVDRGGALPRLRFPPARRVGADRRAALSRSLIHGAARLVPGRARGAGLPALSAEPDLDVRNAPLLHVGERHDGGRGTPAAPRAPVLRFEANRPGPVLGSLARYLEGMKYKVRTAAPGADTLAADVIVVVPDDFEEKIARGEKSELVLRPPATTSPGSCTRPACSGRRSARWPTSRCWPRATRP